jgi:hypothetical protein
MLEINGVSILQNNLSVGRNIFNNWLKNSLSPYPKSKPDCSISSINTVADVGPVYESEPTRVLFYDINSESNNATLSSASAYDLAML